MENLIKKVESYKDEMVKATQELVKIKSVEGPAEEGRPFGKGPGEALDKALEICKGLGFKTVNMDGYVGYAEYGEGEDYIAVLGHLDVVPEGDGWIHPPYAAEIHDDKLYGRGVLDDKGPIVTALYGLKAIKDLNLPISKRVRIIFGTNEETGSNDVPYYVAREKAPVGGFTPDAEFPVIFGEKGITDIHFVQKCENKNIGKCEIVSIKGGLRSNMVPDYCEARVKASDLNAIGDEAKAFGAKIGFKFDYEVLGDEVVLKAVGHSAHGSTPEKGKNAIMAMVNYLVTLCTEQSDLGDFLKLINDKIGFNTKGEGLGCNLNDEPSGDLSFNAGVMELNGNVIRLINNLRYPVTKTIDDVMNPINESVKGTKICVELADDTKPLYYDKQNPVVKNLQKVYNDITGDNIDSIAIGGGTYAKSMPNIVAFGPIFPNDPDVIHQPNEYVHLDKFMQSAKIYAKAIYELAK